MDSELKSEWSRIPHFHTPFYVYKYATGYSAATAFSESILKEYAENKKAESGSNSATAKYLSFLHSGGSDYSLNLLKDAGVDLNTPLPVRVTLEKFRRKLNELKALL